MLYSTWGCRPVSASAMSRTSSGVMCRRSARGCTVIPGVPAATQTSSASSTSGRRPPRELRSLANFFPLTDRLTMEIAICNFPEMLLDDVDDLLGPGLDFFRVLPLDHHAEQGL